MMMRYFGMAVGHKNPANFPVECGQLRKDVLRENTSAPWAHSTSDKNTEVRGSQADQPSESDSNGSLPSSEVDDDLDEDVLDYDY